MFNRAGRFGVLSWVVLRAVLACGADVGQSQPPAGSCHTGGTATGSFVAACNQCGQSKCDAELRDKAGSGYAQQYFGGDGACAAFEGCTCQCLGSGSDPIACATTTCIASLTTACRDANQKAEDCLRAQCATECR
jgi:hypothetical protein